MPTRLSFDSASASEQLRRELAAATRQQKHRSPPSHSSLPRRPILHHLNADSSWLVQLPLPVSTGVEARNGDNGAQQANGKRRRRRRLYYNILIDPWLAGTQSDVASWFSSQWHAEASAAGSVAEVEELIWRVEKDEKANLGEDDEEGDPGDDDDDDDDDEAEPPSPIDAVAISHEFTDHCHRATLLEVSPIVPVFAIREAAALIKHWKHFDTVVTIPPFPRGDDNDTDWHSTSLAPLPPWLGISRLVQTGDVLNYHAALAIVFDPARTGEAEAILYTPHGVEASDVAAAKGLGSRASGEKRIQALALLHGLHRVRVATWGRTALQSNLGAHNGLAVQRALRARYWIGTHDEVKQGAGLVGWFLQREVFGVREAVEAERARRREEKGIEEEEADDEMEGVNWVDLGNGGRKVLV